MSRGPRGGIREEVETDTEGEILPIINSSSKATDLVSLIIHTKLLIYMRSDSMSCAYLVSGGPTVHGTSTNGPNVGGRPPFQKYVTRR